MGLITPDFSEAGSFSKLPEGGVFKARVLSVEQKVSKTGNTYINVKMEIFGANQAEFNGKFVYHMMLTQGKGSFKLLEFLEAAFPGYQKGQPFDTDDMIGKEVEVTITYPRHHVTGEISKYAACSKVTAISPNGGVDVDAIFGEGV